MTIEKIKRLTMILYKQVKELKIKGKNLFTNYVTLSYGLFLCELSLEFCLYCQCCVGFHSMQKTSEEFLKSTSNYQSLLFLQSLWIIRHSSAI